MYTLHYSPGSAAMLVHLVLLETGAPHVLTRVDLEAGEQRSPAYLTLNPHGKVPTMIVDGAPYAEAAALAMLLAERHPEAQLAPAAGEPARAAYLQWMFHLANALQPAFRLWFYPHDGGSDAAAVKDAARARIEAEWTHLDAHLGRHGPHLLGAQPSVADFYATMLMRWSRNMPKPATAWPHLAALAARVKARPAWKRLCEIEGLADWA
ncbi:MAG: glutathione S-transferase [Mizugakiibacter sp.]|uniref:glutathione S-transferase family protein n=1 Tax=Mizugakiibacter sp. TaxID=1972610 RepID=UPI0031C5E993|nr:glutathione S-transferase [Xanthomonadaceae bacterium]